MSGNGDSVRYDMTVRGMSNRPAYQTKPNSTMYISTRKEGRSVTVMDGSKTDNESINKRREGEGMERWRWTWRGDETICMLRCQIGHTSGMGAS